MYISTISINIRGYTCADVTVLIWNGTDTQTDRSLQSLVVVQVLEQVLVAVKIILHIIAHMTVLLVLQHQNHPQHNGCLILYNTLYALCYTYGIGGSDKETRHDLVQTMGYIYY